MSRFFLSKNKNKTYFPRILIFRSGLKNLMLTLRCRKAAKPTAAYLAQPAGVEIRIQTLLFEWLAPPWSYTDPDNDE